jgi:hypothetical protein
MSPSSHYLTKFIPREYLGNAPYPILNEIGVTVCVSIDGTEGSSNHILLNIRPFVSILNPWQVTFPQGSVASWKIEMQVESFNYDVTHQDGDGNEETYTYGPSGYENSEPYGRDVASEGKQTINYLNSGRLVDALPQQLTQGWPLGSGRASYLMSGLANTFSWAGTLFPVPSYQKELTAGEELQFPCPPYHDNSTGNNE